MQLLSKIFFIGTSITCKNTQMPTYYAKIIIIECGGRGEPLRSRPRKSVLVRFPPGTIPGYVPDCSTCLFFMTHRVRMRSRNQTLCVRTFAIFQY